MIIDDVYDTSCGMCRYILSMTYSENSKKVMHEVGAGRKQLKEVACYICKQKFPLYDIRSHYALCAKRQENQEKDTDY